MSTTNYLGLNIPDKNSKGRVVTEVFEPNFTKLDQNAEVVDRDKNAIWGGLDGGGLIEDPSVTKVVGKRYIGADGKAYICLKPSNINNKDNYMPCNVVDNLSKLQNLVIKHFVVYGGITVDVVKNNKIVTVTIGGDRSGSSIPNLAILQKIPIEIGYPKFQIEAHCGNDQNRNLCLIGITTAGNLQVYKGDGDIPYNTQLRCILTYITD